MQVQGSVLAIAASFLDNAAIADCTVAPTIYASGSGGLVFEWIFDSGRVGMFFEPKREESGWCLVSRTNERIESGDLSTLDVTHLMAFIATRG